MTKTNAIGHPKTILSEDQKTLCIAYVKASGFYKLRLAKFLQIDVKTLRKILEEDRSFSLGLKAADAEFCGNIIARARPEFILKTKYRDEFSDSKTEELIQTVVITNYGDPKEKSGQP